MLRAKERSMLIPIPIIQPIAAVNADRLLAFNEVVGAKGLSVGGAQAMLNVALRESKTMVVQPGPKFQVVYWDGNDGLAAAFTPDGVQVGYGHVQWDPDPRKREKAGGMMTYHTAYIVATDYTNMGLGKGMKGLLEDYIAINTTGFGARFLSQIDAETPESRSAAMRMLDRLGYVESAGSPGNYYRVVLKPKHYKHIEHKRPPFTQSAVRGVTDHTRYYR